VEDMIKISQQAYGLKKTEEDDDDDDDDSSLAQGRHSNQIKSFQ